MNLSRAKRYFLRTLSALAALLAMAITVLLVSGLSNDLGTADVALVLGSKVELDGTPSPRLRARLDRTLELYREGCFSTIITSGGTGKEGYDEGMVMRNYLVSKGIPPDQVIVDSEGITTFLSAKNTLEIVRQRKFQSVFVISQYFHLPRARLALRRVGISQVHSGYPAFFESRDIYSSLRELFGYLDYAFLRDYE